MKIIFSILIMLLFVACNSKKDSIKEGNSYPKKNRFIVSENDVILNNLTFETEQEKTVEVLTVDNINPEIYIGQIHFIIDDEKAFYIQQKFSDFMLMECIKPTKEELRKDSVEYELNVMKYMDSIQITELDSISNIILKHKSKLINKDDSWGSPKVISFAVKNDTLKGNFIHDIIKFMNTNGINYYFIRRMNEHELKAVGKLR